MRAPKKKNHRVGLLLFIIILLVLAGLVWFYRAHFLENPSGLSAEEQRRAGIDAQTQAASAAADTLP